MNICDPRKAEIGVEIMPFEIGFVPPLFEKKAEAEMNDNEETRKRCIQEFRIVIKGADKMISGIDFEEDFLLQHLRTRKFNVSRALEALTEFVTLTKKHPEMFSNFNFDITVKAIRKCLLTMLPWRCHEGCAILYVQIGNWDIDDFPLEEVKRLLVVVLTQAMRDPMTQVNGLKTIIDIQSPNFRYMTQCTIANLFLLFHATQHCVPGRYKGVHVVNSNLIFKSVWICIKQFMSKKLQSRVHFHSSPKKLLDFLPPIVVPAKYGGNLIVPDQSEWLRKMMSPEQLAMIGGGALNPI